jgi:hypothetical protein
MKNQYPNEKQCTKITCQYVANTPQFKMELNKYFDQYLDSVQNHYYNEIIKMENSLSKEAWLNGGSRLRTPEEKERERKQIMSKLKNEVDRINTYMAKLPLTTNRYKIIHNIKTFIDLSYVETTNDFNI